MTDETPGTGKPAPAAGEAADGLDELPIRILIKADADVTARDVEGYTVLHIAPASAAQQATTVVIERGAAPPDGGPEMLARPNRRPAILCGLEIWQLSWIGAAAAWMAVLFLIVRWPG